MALIQNGRLTVASLGDSVCTIVRKDRSWSKLSEEHTTSRQDEQLRILNSNGGFILKGKVRGELAVTRAFGNIELKNLIISEPECVQTYLTAKDDLLILSTDGLYRSLTQDHVVNRVRILRAQGKSLA